MKTHIQAGTTIVLSLVAIVYILVWMYNDNIQFKEARTELLQEAAIIEENLETINY